MRQWLQVQPLQHLTAMLASLDCALALACKELLDAAGAAAAARRQLLNPLIEQRPWRVR